MRAAALLIGLLLVAGAAAAQPARGYLTDDWTALPFEAPPATGTPAQAADMAAWRAALSNGEGSGFRRAAADDAAIGGPAPASLFACVLGTSLDDQTTPRLNALLRRTLADVEGAATILKRRFARPRPYEGDNGVRTCVSIPPERRRGTATSYPSSSAAAGVAWAETLAAIAPDQAEALRARGVEIGDGRLTCRVHYLSDVRAGQALGRDLARRLARSPAYRADLRAVRAELAGARRTAPLDCGLRFG